MGADYYFHPHGTLPGDVDEDAVERRRLVALIDQLQEQLDATEKSYDRALQMNIEMHEKLRANRIVVPVIPTDPEAEAAVDKALAEIHEEAHKSKGRRVLADANLTASAVVKRNMDRDDEIEEAHRAINRVREKKDRDLNATPIGTAAHDAEAGEELAVILDDPYATTNAAIDSVRDWYESVVPSRAPKYSSSSLPQVVDALWADRDRERARVRQANGQRALMKDTLQRSQNANRRYKARLKRLRPQVEALTDVANAAFPLFETLMMLSSLALPVDVNAQCEKFHNAFNKAAEALAPPETD